MFFFFQEKFCEEDEIFPAHDEEEDDGEEESLFEEHEEEVGEIGPGGIVVEEDLECLQEGSKGDPSGEFVDIPGHHFEGPSQAAEHDGEHTDESGDRHGEGKR